MSCSKHSKKIIIKFHAFEKKTREKKKFESKVKRRQSETSCRVKINVYSSAHCSLSVEKVRIHRFFIHSACTTVRWQPKKRAARVRNGNKSESKLLRNMYNVTIFIYIYIYVFTMVKREKLISHRHSKNIYQNVFNVYQRARKVSP